MIVESIMCLAMNIYHEARGEPIKGQIAVAVVTMNRVEDNRWPDTPCDVVWQHRQFSWTKDGKSDKMKDQRAKQRAINIATGIYMTYKEGYNYDLYDQVIEHVNGSVYYHADHVNPYWTESVQHVTSIDNHRFYK